LISETERKSQVIPETPAVISEIVLPGFVEGIARISLSDRDAQRARQNECREVLVIYLRGRDGQEGQVRDPVVDPPANSYIVAAPGQRKSVADLE
jgi:hypothetical protein